MNTRIQALTAGALAAIAASVAIPALTGAQASPARSARVAHARPGASQADQLRAIERTRLHALVDADTATARRLMAADFQAVTPSRRHALARRTTSASVAAGVIDYLVFEPVSRIAVRRSGDSAALRYKVSFDLVAGGTRVDPQGVDHRALGTPRRALADRLGAGHRDPEQLRPVPPVDRAARALVRRPAFARLADTPASEAKAERRKRGRFARHRSQVRSTPSRCRMRRSGVRLRDGRPCTANPQAP